MKEEGTMVVSGLFMMIMMVRQKGRCSETKREHTKAPSVKK